MEGGTIECIEVDRLKGQKRTEMLTHQSAFIGPIRGKRIHQSFLTWQLPSAPLPIGSPPHCPNQMIITL